MARIQGFLPKFGNIVIDTRKELLHTIDYIDNSGRNSDAAVSIHTAYINGIPVSGKEAKLVADLIKSANGELNAADFCPRKIKKAEKILKRLRN